MARAISFELPADRNATAPAERRGLRRDHVRLMVLDRATGATEHARFFELGRYLRAGDVLVLNNSRTIPAVLQARTDGGTPAEVRLSSRRSERDWLALLLSPAPLAPGDTLTFDAGLEALVTRIPPGEPLAEIRFSACCLRLTDALYRLGRPVHYEYVSQPWDLGYYQTVYADHPGSVEMPSAGRAFTWELLLRLRRQGVRLAYLSLHAGLSYYMDDRWIKDPGAAPEEFHIPAEAAGMVNAARAGGHRVVAVGTTVVRALEYAGRDGLLSAGHGWADLYVGPGYRLRVVDGLLTGFHEPEASHLDMLSAFIRPDQLHAAYQEAIRQRYLWHEFGDMNLII